MIFHSIIKVVKKLLYKEGFEMAFKNSIKEIRLKINYQKLKWLKN